MKAYITAVAILIAALSTLKCFSQLRKTKQEIIRMYGKDYSKGGWGDGCTSLTYYRREKIGKDSSYVMSTFYLDKGNRCVNMDFSMRRKYYDFWVNKLSKFKKVKENIWFDNNTLTYWKLDIVVTDLQVYAWY